MGESRTVHLKLRTIWLATANNLLVVGDLPRRLVWVRLDAKMERPEDRDASKFRHKELLRWAKEHRGKLVSAALTLIQAWIAKGRPPGTEVMGSYEAWVQVLGGVLKTIGMGEFLANRELNRIVADEDLAQLGPFVWAWWRAFGSDEVSVAQLFNLVAENAELLPYVMSAEKEIGRRQRLGNILKRNRDRVVEGLQINFVCKSKHKKTNRFCLTELKKEAEPPVQPRDFPGLIDDRPRPTKQEHQEVPEDEADDFEDEDEECDEDDSEYSDDDDSPVDDDYDS